MQKRTLFAVPPCPQYCRHIPSLDGSGQPLQQAPFILVLLSSDSDVAQGHTQGQVLLGSAHQMVPLQIAQSDGSIFSCLACAATAPASLAAA